MVCYMINSGLVPHGGYLNRSARTVTGLGLAGEAAVGVAPRLRLRTGIAVGRVPRRRRGDIS